MERLFQTVLDRIHLEIVDLAEQIERLDAILADLDLGGPAQMKPLQLVDLIRQQASGLAAFSTALQHMQLAGKPLDFDLATAELPLAAQRQRLQGLAPDPIHRSADLW